MSVSSSFSQCRYKFFIFPLGASRSVFLDLRRLLDSGLLAVNVLGSFLFLSCLLLSKLPPDDACEKASATSLCLLMGVL